MKIEMYANDMESLKIEIENIGECTATNLRIADADGQKIDNTNILHLLQNRLLR